MAKCTKAIIALLQKLRTSPSRFSFLTRNVRALDLSETNDLFGGYIRRCETTTYDYSTKKDLSVKQLKIVKDK